MSQLENTVLRNIGARLKAARKLRDLTQAEFASLGGVSLGAYHRYEAGTAEPGGLFLANLNNAGEDVIYLLTGIRSAALASARQSALLDLFDGLAEPFQDALLMSLRAFENAQQGYVIEVAQGSGVGTGLHGRRDEYRAEPEQE